MPEIIKYKGYKIEITPDEDVENPYFDCDCLTDVVSWHRNYNFNTTTAPDYRQKPNGAGKYPVKRVEAYESPQEVWEAYEKGELVYVAPLYAYEHGGITVNLGSMDYRWPDQQWDCGLLGMVYVTKEKAKAEFPKLANRTLWLACEKVAKTEVETFDQYLTGDVWGYWVWKDARGVDKYDGESCWGFYGYDYCLSEAKSVVDYLVEKQESLELVQREDWMLYSCPI